MAITHKPKTGPLLTGTEYEAADAHIGEHAEDHDHDGSPTQKLTQANSHQSPDTDAATGSLHHTIGAGATQSAAGNHVHSGNAPDSVDYLVGTASAGLSAEIAVGTSPGGELGGTWASPTVDATHAGSTHSAASDTHVADTSAAHAASSIGFTPNGSIAATDVQAAIQEVRDEGSTTPSTAPYVTTAADAGLSAEVVIPGLAGHGSIAGLGGGGITEEYESGTTGLSWSPTTPGTIDSDTTVPSHLYLEWTGVGGVETLGLRSWVPSAALDARMHLALQKADDTATNAAGLIITNSDNTSRALVQLAITRTAASAQAFTYAAGAYTQRGSTWSSLGQGQNYYLRILRDGSNNWSFYWSGTGRAWTLVATQALTFTVANIGLRVSHSATSTNFLISDFLRTDV